MTDKEKEKEKNIIRDIVSQKKDRKWLFIKRTEKKDISRNLVSK